MHTPAGLAEANVPAAVVATVARAASHPFVRRVVLFGSRARGDHGPRSDVDLAVEAPEADRRAWLDLVHQLEAAETLLFVQVIRLETASPALRARILREGVTLYDQSESAAEPQ